MEYCFLILKKRGEYFNLKKVMRDCAPETSFVLISPCQSQDTIDPDFKGSLQKVYFIPEVSFERCREIIASHAGSTTLTGRAAIVCTDESLLITAARLREYFKINGARPYQYVPFKDKRIMKEVLACKNIRTPRFLDFDGIYTKDSLRPYHDYVISVVGSPYVVKPLVNGGSSHVAIIETFEDLKKWYEHDFEAGTEYGIDEFTKGDMYHCDSFVVDGEIKFCKVCKYLYPCLDFTKGLPLGSIPIIEDSKLCDEIVRFNAKVLSALKAPNGALHLEVIVGPSSEITFIEIGARPAGACINLMYEKNYGISLYELALRCELGLALDFNIKNNLYHGWVYLSSYPGTVNSINVPKLKSRAEIEWLIKPGDRIESYPSNIMSGDSGKILLHSGNYNDLLSDAETLKHHRPYQ